jgi:lipoprotein NlpI
MQTTTITEPLAVICEYAKAIELDPELSEAYNNLGVLMTTVTDNNYQQASCVRAAVLPVAVPGRSL